MPSLCNAIKSSSQRAAGRLGDVAEGPRGPGLRDRGLATQFGDLTRQGEAVTAAGAEPTLIYQGQDVIPFLPIHTSPQNGITHVNKTVVLKPFRPFHTL